MLLCCSLECTFCNAKNISYGGWKWKKLSYGKITGNFEGHLSRISRVAGWNGPVKL
jgi:hypothetical protein